MTNVCLKFVYTVANTTSFCNDLNEKALFYYLLKLPYLISQQDDSLATFYVASGADDFLQKHKQSSHN